MQLLAFMNPWELAILAFVALLLFGTRLPGAARSLGKSITEFKKGMKGIEEEAEEAPKLQR